MKNEGNNEIGKEGRKEGRLAEIACWKEKMNENK